VRNDAFTNAERLSAQQSLSSGRIFCCAGQHIALHEPSKANHIGLVCTKCSPWQVRGLHKKQQGDEYSKRLGCQTARGGLQLGKGSWFGLQSKPLALECFRWYKVQPGYL
jgi:hypothetical protein